MFEDHQVSPHGRLRVMPRKRCFREHHHQIDTEAGFIFSDYGDDIEHC